MTTDSSAGDPLEGGDPAKWARLANEAATIGPNDPARIKASLAMFVRVSEHWDLGLDERENLLGGVSSVTLEEWLERPDRAEIPRDTRERIRNMTIIDFNAHALFAPEFADRWVRQPNAAFDGGSALERMLHGAVEDIIVVRRYLERARHGSPPDDATEARGEPVRVSMMPNNTVHGDDEIFHLS
jgi:hypothetical protein